jgi:hypothetical protein
MEKYLLIGSEARRSAADPSWALSKRPVKGINNLFTAIKRVIYSKTISGLHYDGDKIFVFLTPTIFLRVHHSASKGELFDPMTLLNSSSHHLSEADHALLFGCANGNLILSAKKYQNHHKIIVFSTGTDSSIYLYKNAIEPPMIFAISDMQRFTTLLRRHLGPSKAAKFLLNIFSTK